MKSLYIAGVFPVLLGACSTTPSTLPDVSSLSEVAAPNVPARQTVSRPVLVGFERREPTGPQSWRKLNDEQTVTGGHS